MYSIGAACSCFAEVAHDETMSAIALEAERETQLMINLTIIANVIEKMENDCVIMLIIIIVLFPIL